MPPTAHPNSVTVCHKQHIISTHNHQEYQGSYLPSAEVSQTTPPIYEEAEVK